LRAVELGGLDQGVDRRGAVAAGVGTGEQIVLAADRDTAQRPLGGVVVEGEAAVVEASQQRLPARPHVPEGLGEFGFAGQSAQCRLRPGGQRLGDRLGPLLTFPSPNIGRQTGDRLVDLVEVADAVERLLGGRRAGGGMDVEDEMTGPRRRLAAARRQAPTLPADDSAAVNGGTSRCQTFKRSWV
jgi:hypothetical protein